MSFHVGRSVNSDWFLNSSLMVLFQFCQNVCVQRTITLLLINNHLKLFMIFYVRVCTISYFYRPLCSMYSASGRDTLSAVHKCFKLFLWKQPSFQVETTPDVYIFDGQTNFLRGQGQTRMQLQIQLSQCSVHW